MTFQTKLAAAYGLAIFILCAMGVVSFRNAHSVEETRQWGRHSNVVLHRIEAFHVALEGTEETAFDFAGTNDAAALAEFDRSRTEALGVETEIRTLTVDNASQQARLDRLEPQLARYLDLLRESIVANDPAPAPSSAGAFKRSPERAKAAREVANVFRDLSAEEDRLAVVRRVAIDDGMKRSAELLVFGYASAILLSGFCVVILRGEMRARNAIQRQLENAQASLEVRVAKRTEDLSAANSALERQIDERKKAERQVQQLNASLEMRVEQRTLELTQAVRDLDSFCYSVAHDLRAPLRHVDGFSRILENEYAGELTADARHHLERIVQAVNQMGRLIDDLLELSRISRKKLSRRRVSLSDMVERLIGNFRVMPEGQSIEWRVEPLPDLNCDPALLEVVLTNLISNAVKFTRDANPRLIQFGAIASAGVTNLYVRDNGVGFDPQYADKLFGVFQRLHRQESFVGTGIGLATVHRIVQRHGGTIRAESQPGQGATFFFSMGAQTAVTPVPELEEVKHG